MPCARTRSLSERALQRLRPVVRASGGGRAPFPLTVWVSPCRRMWDCWRSVLRTGTGRGRRSSQRQRDEAEEEEGDPQVDVPDVLRLVGDPPAGSRSRAGRSAGSLSRTWKLGTPRVALLVLVGAARVLGLGGQCRACCPHGARVAPHGVPLASPQHSHGVPAASVACRWRPVASGCSRSCDPPRPLRSSQDAARPVPEALRTRGRRQSDVLPGWGCAGRLRGALGWRGFGSRNRGSAAELGGTQLSRLSRSRPACTTERACPTLAESPTLTPAWLHAFPETPPASVHSRRLET